MRSRAFTTTGKLCLPILITALSASQLGCGPAGSGGSGSQSSTPDTTFGDAALNPGNSTSDGANADTNPGSGSNTDSNVIPPGGSEPPPLTGVIFTTTAHGLMVNGNLYANWCDVYLNAGQAPNQACAATGLPEDTYYFQVTDPTGSVLLSSDPIARRMVRAEQGWLVEYLGGASQGCDHQTGSGKCPGAINVQLMPFNGTPDPNGACKVWLTPVSAYDEKNANSSFGFLAGRSLTQTFRCTLQQHWAMAAQLSLASTPGQLEGSIVGGMPPYTCSAVASDEAWIIRACTVKADKLTISYEAEGACKARITMLVADAEGFQTEASQCVNACQECELSPASQKVRQGQPAQDICLTVPCNTSGLALKWSAPAGVALAHDTAKCITPDTSTAGTFNYCITLTGEESVAACCATVEVSAP